MPQDLPPETLSDLINALEKGRTIDAIKTYRNATGLGLKESKDAVESLYAELREQDPERFPKPKPSAGCGSAAALFALTVCLFLYLAQQA